MDKAIVKSLCEAGTGRCLLPRVRFANSAWSRFVGLMGRSGLEAGTGLYFPRCSSIHMFFMRFPIDVVYFEAGRSVVKIMTRLKPWRLSFCPGADSVLEASAGWVGSVEIGVGDQVEFREPREN